MFSGAIDDALLDVDDLPGRWEQAPDGSIRDGGSCGVQTVGPVVETADRSFTSPPTSSITDLLDVSFLAQRVQRYGDVGVAEAAFDELAEQLEECRELDEVDAGGGRTQGTLAPFPLDVDADEHLAFAGRLVLTDAEGTSMPGATRIVVLREADVVTWLVQLGYRPELQGDIEPIAERAVERITRPGS